MKMQDITQGTRVRHYKGRVYTILSVARHTETEEPLVIYQSEDGAKTWARPLPMFIEDVSVDNTLVPRFQKISG